MPAVNARPYRSPKRAEQAAATRMAILNAAGELFDGGGYVRTTTAAVARKAGVSEAMVFAAFGSKAGLVAGLINRAVTDGDESSELVATDAWSEAAASDDAMTAVRRFAKLTAAIQRRTWKLIELSRTASDGDPGMADLLRQGAQKRRSDCHNFISTAVANSLRGDRTVDEATDVLWAYTSSDLYRLIVDGAGWSHDQYVVWLVDTLTTALLARE